MNFWGKIIGTATGYALGGIEGAIVGAVSGHIVDVYTSWAEAHVDRKNGQTNPGSGSERRNAGSRYNFTLAVVTLGAKLAKVDGPVTKSEIAAFKEVFRVPPEEVHNVGRMFDRARTSPTGYEPYAQQLAQMFAENHATLDEIVSCLFHVALADGALRPEETNYIRRVARLFGFSDSYFQRKLEENTGYPAGAYGSSSGRSYSSSQGNRNQRANAPPPRRPPEPANNPYKVLGLSETSSDKDVKIKYRKLVREHHPDNHVAAGKSKEIVAKATATLALINAAYDQILKERHIN